MHVLDFDNLRLYFLSLMMQFIKIAGDFVIKIIAQLLK